MNYKVRMTAKANGLSDKFTGVIYHTNDICEFNKQRYEELLKGGYVELIEQEEEIKTEVVEPKEVKKAVKKTTKKK